MTSGSDSIRATLASTWATAAVSTSGMSPRSTARSSRHRATATRYPAWKSASRWAAGTAARSRANASVMPSTAALAAVR